MVSGESDQSSHMRMYLGCWVSDDMQPHTARGKSPPACEQCLYEPRWGFARGSRSPQYSPRPGRGFVPRPVLGSHWTGMPPYEIPSHVVHITVGVERHVQSSS